MKASSGKCSQLKQQNFYAKRLGQDEEKQAITGLLHHYDSEIYPTIEEHPLSGLQCLRDKGVNEQIVIAMGGHADTTGILRES